MIYINGNLLFELIFLKLEKSKGSENLYSIRYQYITGFPSLQLVIYDFKLNTIYPGTYLSNKSLHKDLIKAANQQTKNHYNRIHLDLQYHPNTLVSHL